MDLGRTKYHVGMPSLAGTYAGTIFKYRVSESSSTYHRHNPQPVLVLEVSSDHLVEGLTKEGCNVTVKKT